MVAIYSGHHCPIRVPTTYGCEYGDMHTLTLGTKSDNNRPSRYLYITPNLVDPP
ncbi:hypothetical protein PILCRDRAFT_15936 [Piloderma croceum F 1598]|uniref:Uncharacterized protein n=1 Tax=Piloderma croceum (strain F 1598) TaxID=765440 RepID=A0A0C3AFT7_PILCF|nr:hypothetical protein PILCRDRAFT_15936 [Piloderma croceum F 1598]